MSQDLEVSFDSSVRKFKVSMVGDMAVGKTCLSLQYVKGLFREDHRATISDIETKAVLIDNQKVVFQIWDTAGQERFRSLLPLYLKGISGAVIVYDVTEKASFENVMNWITEVRKYADNDTVLLLVGNKLDLVKSGTKSRAVEEKDGQALANEVNLVFIEASAKTAENVNEAFMRLGAEMLKRRVFAPPPQDYTKVDTSVFPDGRKTKRCCH